MTFDGATAGITSVLVFGAGTNYALLLISRYREELTCTDDHRVALRTAVSRAGPAIVASNATVVLALLTLVFATAPATRSLGVHAACGLVIAVLLVLLVLPPLLSLFGTRLFWPFIPHRGGRSAVTTGVWHGIAAWVTGHAGRVTITSVVVLGLMGIGLLGTPIGLSQTEQFRVKAESVSGYETLSAHFPSWHDRSHARDRRHRSRRRDPASDHNDTRRGLGQRRRMVGNRPDPMVGDSGRCARIPGGLQNRCRASGVGDDSGPERDCRRTGCPGA